MPEEPSPKGGTLEPNDTDAPKPGTGGTSEPDDTDAGDGKPGDETPLHLQWKEKAERVNEVEQALAESKAREERLRAELEAGRQPAAGSDEQRMYDEIAQLEADNSQLDRFIAAGDKVAAATKRSNERYISLRQDTLDAFTLQRVPEAKQRDIYAAYQADKKRPLGERRYESLADVVDADARHAMATENAALKKRLAELEKNGEEDPPERKPENVPRTPRSVDSPSRPTKVPSYTKREWHERQEALYEAGDDATARKEQLLLRDHKIVLKA